MRLPVKAPAAQQRLRCAIYTRVSTDHGLEQAFNSLHSQREAAEAYVKSQAHEGWQLQPERYDDGGFSGGSIDRPALQRLLAEVEAGRVEIIVVYKVDRLTRALSDFAKLVELFDRHGVSFVSVTQAFNTTSSMGRLTLNVLLSFAQFERELTGERIRDKIAASKRKGIGMGGVVPLGYRAEARALHVVPEHAGVIRLIYQQYLELGSINALAEALEREGLHAPDRRDTTGGRVKGGPFSRGHLSHILSARLYLGEVTHRGTSHPGQHAAIVDPGLFEAVAAKLAIQSQGCRQTKAPSGALLIGRVFDASGNAMSPSHTRKSGVRYRYYVSRALLRGRKRAGTGIGLVGRVPATVLEDNIIAALREAVGRRRGLTGAIGRGAASPADADAFGAGDTAGLDGPARRLIDQWLVRVVVRTDALVMTLKANPGPTGRNPDDATTEEVNVPWSLQRRSARATLIVPEGGTADLGRSRQPMPEDVRRHLLVSIARARAWMEALISGSAADTVTLAVRAGCSERQVRLLLPLASLAPDLVQAVVEGRIAAGYGVARLCRGLPTTWDEQRKMVPIVPAA